MISFWRQLKFLLWKAALIKWRQKFWLGVEVIVPLLLFTMLALIRTRDFSDPRSLCHYDSKGMPSAGMLPFLHSMFCSLSNECNAQPTTGDEGFFINNETTPNESLLVDILYYGSLQLRQIGEDPDSFNSTIRDIANLVHLLANVNMTNVEPVKLSRVLNQSEAELETLFEEIGATKPMATAMAGSTLTPAFVINMIPMMTGDAKENPLQKFLDCVENNTVELMFGGEIDCPLYFPILCIPFQFDQSFVLPPGTRVTTADRRSLCNLRPSTSSLLKMNSMRPSLQPQAILTQGVAPLNLVNGSVLTLLEMYSSLHSVSSWAKEQPMAKVHNLGKFLSNTSSVKGAIFCGKNPLDTSEAGLRPNPKGAETPFNKLRDKLIQFLKTVTPGREKKHDKDFCGEVPVIIDLNCSQIESALLSSLRPIFQGYILVSPKSPAVEKLVEVLEQPLRDFDAFRRLLFEWPGMADAFQQALYESDFWPASQNVLAYLRKSHPPLPFPTKVEKLKFFLEHAFGPPTDRYSIGAITKELATELNTYTKCINTNRFFIVENEEEMEQTATCLTDYQQYFSGIAFQNSSENATEFDPFVTYKIRHLATLVDGTSGLMDTRRPFSRDIPFVDLKYLTYGFSFLQEAVDRALMQEITGFRPNLGMFAQQQPYPCVVQDIFNVANFLGLCIILSFIVPAALLVKNIVLEKEMKLKEQMRIMGLGDSVHFVSWAIAAFVLNFISVLAISLILRYGRVVAHADVSLLFVVFALYALSSVAMSLLVSTMFSNANMATAAITIVYFLFVFPFQLTVKTKNPAFSTFTLLFPQTVISYAAMMIAEADSWQDGAKWSNLYQLQIPAYDVTLVQCLIALAVDSLIFFILSWYLSAIFPGVYGVSQKWYFPVTKSYWFPNSVAGEGEIAETEFDKINASDMFEVDPTEQTMTVRIAGLRKVYGNGTRALDGLNMRLYEGQITALLGHNGAGKTTTMSMLCGLFSPSSGSATIYGRDIRREMRQVRDVLGVCPQQNVLFPLLTVSEQLRFFAALKGTATAKLYAAANDILDAVNLTEKADSLVETLSGGQKRRLCIGIALIGGSKFIILDEPTAGVDVNSRKDIWKLLQKNKHGRTILLSTHHMDEADVLSDRVAVLSEGQLVTLGSPVFLKRRFGESMQLIACKREKKLNYQKAIATVVSDSPLHGLIQLQDMNDDEVIFSIPINTDSKKLEKFFIWFEDNVEVLMFSDYGISAPTLQQIFIRLAPQREYQVPKVSTGCFSRLFGCLRRGRVQDETDQTALIRDASSPQLDVSPNGLSPSASNESIQDEYDFEPPPPITGLSKTLAHIRALLTCRLYYTKRNVKTTVFEVILPILLLLAAEIYAKVALPSSSQLVTISQMPLPLVTNLLAREPDAYINAWDQNITTYAHRILESFVTEPGMGTTCAYGADEAFQSLRRSMKDHKELDAFKNFVVADCSNGTSKGNWYWGEPENATYNADVNCQCEDQRWNCTLEDYPLWDHNYVLLNTTDRIWDFTGWNLSQFALDATVTYNYTRYRPFFMGGFSLGHHSLRASSPSQVGEAQSGWRLMLSEIASTLPLVNLNLSSVPATSLPINDTFSEDITLTDLVDLLLANMDVEENAKVWFNNKVWPSLPIYQSALSNALLRLLSPNRDAASLGILTINHPMNETVNEALTTNAVQKLVTFRIILILMVLCIVPAGFTVFLVEDRVSGSLHMQMVSGLAKTTYWTTGYAFDLCIYTISAMTILLIYLAFGVKDFCFSADVFFSFFLLFLLYGMCAILWAYCLQRRFSVAALSFILISIGTFFLGAITTLTVIIIEQMMQTDATLATSHAVCSSLFLLLPQYNLGMAIFRGASAYQLLVVGEQFLGQMNRMDLVNQLPIPSELSWDMMGVHCVALCCHIFLAIFVLAVLEHDSFGFLRRAESKAATVLMEGERGEEDEDVERENLRVKKMDDRDCPLVVRELTKTYTKKQLAVKGVSFAVDGGECFGLLGLNGAGKTTTFGMLTGKLLPSSGVVNINGVSVQRGSSSAFAQVGYCPQFDALNAQLTTKENLVLFARIRAIPEHAIDSLADRLLRALHLRPYAKILTSSLSGGNKRKLSVAIALISQPSLILLDEPSAGMDPGSQQFLWRVIERLRRGGKAVVMTSHSMEECEALCTRIAIMDKGRVRCLGSKQHLKNKFGEGYSLTLKLTSSEETTTALASVKHELPSARLQSVHCSTLFFHIDRENISIARILRAVNKVKTTVQLEDFSLSQATLDEVFQCLATRLDGASSLPFLPTTASQNTLSTMD